MLTTLKGRFAPDKADEQCFGRKTLLIPKCLIGRRASFANADSRAHFRCSVGEEIKNLIGYDGKSIDELITPAFVLAK
jgi:hypothetical protein